RKKGGAALPRLPPFAALPEGAVTKLVRGIGSATVPASEDGAAETMRVAVIDIGTNSTRLLVGEVGPAGVTELERRSTVTRLGRGVDTSGTLAAEAIEDVCAAVDGYIQLYREHDPERVVAIATSAVRDADNGSAFLAELRERFALDARVLDGA